MQPVALHGSCSEGLDGDAAHIVHVAALSSVAPPPIAAQMPARSQHQRVPRSMLGPALHGGGFDLRGDARRCADCASRAAPPRTHPSPRRTRRSSSWCRSISTGRQTHGAKARDSDQQQQNAIDPLIVRRPDVSSSALAFTCPPARHCRRRPPSYWTRTTRQRSAVVQRNYRCSALCAAVLCIACRDLVHARHMD